MPSLQAIPVCHKWIMDSTQFVKMDLMGFAGYAIFGYFLSSTNYRINKLLLLTIFIGCAIIQGVLTYNHVGLLYSSDKFWIITIIESACIFLLSKEFSTVLHGGSIIVELSSLMMGVYIIHPVFLEHIPTELWCVEYYWLGFIIVLGGALVSSYLIKKIPIVGNWLLSV